MQKSQNNSQPTMLKHLPRRLTTYRCYHNGKNPILLTTREEYLNSTSHNQLFQFLQDSVRNGKLQINKTALDNNGRSVNLMNTNETINATLVQTKQNDNFLDTINSSNTLPITTTVKSTINIKGIPDWRLQPTVWFKTGHKLVKLYRESLQLTIRLFRNRENLNTSNILRQLETNQHSNLITRSDFVNNIIRLHEIKKLPKFGVLLLIFEELVLLLMYWKPELAIHRCLGLRSFKKITSKYAKDYNNVRTPHLNSYKSPYHLDKSKQLSLLKSLHINKIPNWKLQIWHWFNVKDKFESQIEKLLQYLIIDDWLLLLRLIRAEAPLLINDNELVNLVLERQLYLKNEDLNKMINDPVGQQILLNRLVCYWSTRFNGIDLKNGSFKFIDKWGVNNINLLNFSGCINELNLETLMTKEKMVEFYGEKLQLNIIK